ncbi:uncharacterized protein LAESUDRAFT_723583 [Laetiporus sulphureus 93-53]|uniref:Peptidase C14 caspase domain-containing protein n=1 Tax=Laetiporus sulphureus 93-53 TaxID=1314785 RepID=A0A165FAJ6_9APHY|nr:uncharacterized protein LAESUDRAFT_723583 [Laetiporus sulphureus 93-53]KZT08676.1 hypothetical protein LAESUDRAFT_723583 [Laetiporus sulphureus 93-53]
MSSQTTRTSNAARAVDSIPQPWAVLIGVDKYRYAPWLSRAVTDARNIETYLLRDLHVPSEQIVLLLDEDATRARILDALYTHLRDNDNIKPGDPIYLFFAGRGVRYPVTDGKPVNAILPVDRGEEVTLEDGSTGSVLDISERELEHFFDELNASKGPNNTVMFDCSFFIDDNPPPRTRSARPLQGVAAQDLIKAAEQEPRRRPVAGSSALSSGSFYDQSGSRVFMIGCQPDQYAYET